MMTATIRAVYQGGVLRPVEPLDLPDGATVHVTVDLPAPIPYPFPPASPAEEEIFRRIQAARTPEELFAAANDLPQSNDGYDLRRALNENRRRSGAAPLFPPEYLEGER